MKKETLLQKMRHYKQSVFIGHLLLMILMLTMALLPLLVSGRVQTSNLTEYYLEDLEESVERGCDRMSGELFRTYAIPNAIQNSKYYDEMAVIGEGTLPQNYAWLLSRLGESLGNQVYLAGDSVERLVYFPNVNSICTNSHSFIKAEDCFVRHLEFSETETETILNLLNKRNSAAILPMQGVSIASAAPKDYLAIIIFPVGAETSVMSIYERDTILSYLGLDTLPEGSFFRITDKAGNLIMEDGFGNGEPPEDYHRLTSEVDLFGLQVQLWVSPNYFDELLHPAYRISLILSLVTLVVGVVFCVLFADISTRRIRKLARRHHSARRRPGALAMIGDEVDYLEHIIAEANDKADLLQQRLFSGALARAFSGALLSENDEEVLRRCFAELKGECHVALITLPTEINLALKTTILPESLAVPFYCEEISEKSSGVLFSGGEEGVAELAMALEFLGRAVSQNGDRLVCGISGMIDAPDRIHIAVRQARIAMQNNEEVSVYSDEDMQSAEENLLWLQHERLYQSIQNRNEEEALRLIREFAKHRGAGHEAFYSTLFILRSAATELGVELPELDEVRYENRSQWWENVGRLEALLRLLLLKVGEKESSSESDLCQKMLGYIRDNSADPGLCIDGVADQFNILPKNAYAIIREATKMSFREYILYIRMRKAAHLLCGTQMGIAEIAQACGYPAVSTFFRVFKNYFDCTPGQYRLNGGESTEETGESNENG